MTPVTCAIHFDRDGARRVIELRNAWDCNSITGGGIMNWTISIDLELGTKPKMTFVVDANIRKRLLLGDFQADRFIPRIDRDI